MKNIKINEKKILFVPYAKQIIKTAKAKEKKKKKKSKIKQKGP
jgi:hypothetical protein